MLYLYSILSMAIMGISLLAMDQKADNSGAQKSSTSNSMQSVPSRHSVSYHMTSKFTGAKGYKDRIESFYKYPDGSKVTHTLYYKNSKK